MQACHHLSLLYSNSETVCSAVLQLEFNFETVLSVFQVLPEEPRHVCAAEINVLLLITAELHCSKD